jgi:hypothetical protein
MARHTKDSTRSPQTAASLQEAVRQLNLLAAELQASAMLMQADPVVPIIQAPWRTSLKDGLKFLRNWVEGVRAEINEAKLERSALVSDLPESVSSGHINGAKPSGKLSKKDRR